MRVTDIFIRRPVLALVVSLLLVVLGLRAAAALAVRQYPKTENAVVTVTTTYYGADAATVAGFITQPLESAIAQAQGIDYVSSSSIGGVSVITATLRLNYDANRALTEINSQVTSVLNQLPREAQQPVLKIMPSDQTAAMYLGFDSGVMEQNGVTDYLERVVKPGLDSVPGVQSADILGGRRFALRAWLDPTRMAAHGISADDVYRALGANNYLAALGSTKGDMVTVDLTAATSLHSVGEFKQLVVKSGSGSIVRLQDVANVVLGAEDYDHSTAFDGKEAVFIGINVAPNANVLDVVRDVRSAFTQIQAHLPNGLHGKIVYDGTTFIRSSIDEVLKTLAEALGIVTLVIFLFLGSPRAVIIPVIAMPLSLIGTLFVMLILGYSINLLTLLALVLSIGLVVDDAIIVVENVDRHMKEEGRSPLQAALLGARELAGPIVAMTIVLVAVYVPIGFQGGLTGALFTEFAFTLAGAVAVSAVVALTLSPVMASRFFKAEQRQSWLVRRIDTDFGRLHDAYLRVLHGTLATWKVPVVMGGLLLGGVGYLFATSKSELAPQEDRGVVLAQIQGPPDATHEQMQLYTNQVFDIAHALPEYDQMFQVTGVPSINQGIGGVLLKPWDQRARSADELQNLLQTQWNGIAGARVVAFQFPPLPGARGLPVEFVIKTTEPFESLYEVAEKVRDKAVASGMFFFVDHDLKLDKPQSDVVVDRDLVASLGMTQQDVGAALGRALGGGYVNYFSIDGRAYKVIPQVRQDDRLNPAQVLDYQIRAPDGAMLPAANFAHLETKVVPRSVNRFQQLNAATIAGVPAVPQNQALAFLDHALHEVAPTGYGTDYSGQSRQLVQESGGFIGTLLFAIFIVFLALAAQFNSVRDPAVILVSVPMALFGALLCINLAPPSAKISLNIYTQVGLVTLMGLISKHGILMVQFANELQRQGMGKREAIERAAATRLRPILMTTAAMVLGVVPLVIASGAGAAGRRNMGIVIFAGLSIGTLFTLFVVPAFYMLLAARHQEKLAPELQSLAELAKAGEHAGYGGDQSA